MCTIKGKCIIFSITNKKQAKNNTLNKIYSRGEKSPSKLNSLPN